MPEDWNKRFIQSQLESARRPQDPAAEAVFCSARKSTLVDSDGNSWIDLVCGFSSLNFGHSFQPLVDVANQQLTRLVHVGGAMHQPGIELAETLLGLLYSQCPLAGEQQYRVIFNSSGARGIEAAWKAATEYRPGRMVVLSPSLHGRSVATATLSETNQAALSEMLGDRVTVWPKEKYPGSKAATSTGKDDGAGEIADYLARNANEISALLVEPALTARGYIFPPSEFFLKLREVTLELGILMIADEIQTGVGRCSNFLFSLDQGWLPDVIGLGKSLGGGLLPIAATLGRKDVLERLPPGAESETFAGTPLACSIANEVLRLLQSEAHFQRGCTVASQLRRDLREAFTPAPTSVGQVTIPVQVSGQAATAVIDFLAPEIPVDRAQKRAEMFARLCATHRLRVQWTGPQRTRIVMLPALTISDSELADATRRLAATVSEFLAKLESDAI
ncbi:MAG: aminotransferase class III-fold pyridoxal phosphate-dependent enzyme [Planctomycetota bacterium]